MLLHHIYKYYLVGPECENLINLPFFTLYPEYFISVSLLYVLIVVVLITYNVYGLMLQKAVSECIALILLMSCYLMLNDDLHGLEEYSAIAHNSLINDYIAFLTKMIICFSSAVYFLIIANSLKDQRLTAVEYLLLLLFSVLGLMLLCSSGDFLTAYLAIELASLSCYLLASFKKTSSYSIDGGIKYFITGAVSSAFFLLGTSLIYGFIGSISFGDLRSIIEFEWFDELLLAEFDTYNGDIWATFQIIYFFSNLLDSFMQIHIFEQSLLDPYEHDFIDVGLVLILFSLFIKLALAPFHLWSLDVYEGSPTSATFFFAVISKLSIFVLIYRLLYFTFMEFCHWIDEYDIYPFSRLLCTFVGVFSIFVGSFGGLKQRKLKTLLAYSSTSHMGYALLAFSMFWTGLEMMLFYFVTYIIAGLATWSIVLFLRLKKKGLGNKYSKELGDLVLLKNSNPALAFSFAVTLFSIAGIPPLIGFVAKLNVFYAVILWGFYAVALISILFSVVSTFYYIRIIKVLYFENSLVGQLYYPIDNNKPLILSILIFLLIFMFFDPTILYLLAKKLTFALVFTVFPSNYRVMKGWGWPPKHTPEYYEHPLGYMSTPPIVLMKHSQDI